MIDIAEPARLFVHRWKPELTANQSVSQLLNIIHQAAGEPQPKPAPGQFDARKQARHLVPYVALNTWERAHRAYSTTEKRDQAVQQTAEAAVRKAMNRSSQLNSRLARAATRLDSARADQARLANSPPAPADAAFFIASAFETDASQYPGTEPGNRRLNQLADATLEATGDIGFWARYQLASAE